VLIIDADEELTPNTQERLRSLLTTQDIKAPQGFAFRALSPGQAPLWTRALFPRLPGVHFQGRVHEQLVYQSQLLPLSLAPLQFFHHCSPPSRKKHVYYESLILMALQDSQLLEEARASLYSHLGDHRKALGKKRAAYAAYLNAYVRLPTGNLLRMQIQSAMKAFGKTRHILRKLAWAPFLLTACQSPPPTIALAPKVDLASPSPVKRFMGFQLQSDVETPEGSWSNAGACTSGDHERYYNSACFTHQAYWSSYLSGWQALPLIEEYDIYPYCFIASCSSRPWEPCPPGQEFGNGESRNCECTNGQSILNGSCYPFGIEASTPIISPNGDGQADEVNISVEVAPENPSAYIEILGYERVGNNVNQTSGNSCIWSRNNITANTVFAWNGRCNSGKKMADGVYTLH